MSIGRFALFRPFQITAGDSVTFYQPHTASSGTENIPGAGTCGQLPAIAKWLEDALQVDDANMSVTFITDKEDSNYGKLQCVTTTDSFKLGFTGEALRDALGFDYDGVSSFTSPYTLIAHNVSEFAWWSQFGTEDQAVWELSTQRLFDGQQTRTGRVVGNSTGDPLYRRTLKITAERAEKVLGSRAQASTDSDRCLETFVYKSLSSNTEVDDSVAPRGIYLWYDATTVVPTDDYDTREGVQELLTTDPDLFCFASSDTGGLTGIKAQIPGTMIYWRADLKLTRAHAETWDLPA